jgi:pimeloyl-ACP methyl ester carboxylesterase
MTPAAAGKTTIVLLPGLHGTTGPFAPFLRECPPQFSPVALSFPLHRPLGYDELEEYVMARLPRAGRLILLGESFSGPLALRLAARGPHGLAAVVLSASFVRSPAPAFLRHLPWDLIARLIVPAAFLRYALAGGKRWAHLLPEIKQAVRDLRPDVLAQRIRSLLSVDAKRELVCCPVPILYLQGLRDRLVPSRCFQEIASVRPDTRRRTIDAPHMLLQAAPQEAWRCIEEFLDQAIQCCHPDPPSNMLTQGRG